MILSSSGFDQRDQLRGVCTLPAGCTNWECQLSRKKLRSGWPPQVSTLQEMIASKSPPLRLVRNAACARLSGGVDSEAPPLLGDHRPATGHHRPGLALHDELDGEALAVRHVPIIAAPGEARPARGVEPRPRGPASTSRDRTRRRSSRDRSGSACPLRAAACRRSPGPSTDRRA